MNKIFLKIFFPAVVLITVILIMVFGAASHVLRQEANNPQIAMSEVLSVKLSDGTDANLFLNKLDKVNPKESTAPFFIVYNEHGYPDYTNTIFNDPFPIPPKGVFDYSKNAGEDRVTWKLADGTRIAAVINRYDGPSPGYVLAGKNLKETEWKIKNFSKLMFIIWVIGVAVGGILAFILSKLKK